MQSSFRGWISGSIGVMIFAGSLPATRVAIIDFDPVFLTCARAVVAAALAGLLLRGLRQHRPDVADLWPLLIVAFGVVVGFPLFTAMALQHVSAAHSIVFVGLLPLSTALFGVWRTGERPRPAFWLFSLLGSACVGGYAIVGGVQPASWSADLLMVAAVLVCGLGYAEGARLSRRLGGWQVISWALVLALPAMILGALATLPASFEPVSGAAWWGLAYVSLFSMLIGFVFWYHGLAHGGIAAVGQLQLLQPFIGFMLAALVLNETVDAAMLAGAGGALVCVVGARRFAAKSSAAAAEGAAAASAAANPTSSASRTAASNAAANAAPPSAQRATQ